MFLSRVHRGASILHLQPVALSSRAFHACAFGGSGTGITNQRRRDSMSSNKKFVGRPCVRSESSSSSSSNSSNNPKASSAAERANANANVSRTRHASSSSPSRTGPVVGSSTATRTETASATAALSSADIAKKFPYSRLTDSQFHQMSQELNSDLPLQAFFAGHRPLMLMDPNIGNKAVEDDAGRDFDWVTLPAVSPVEEAERVFLPLKIIGGIGPFDSKKLQSLSSSTGTGSQLGNDYKGSSNINNKLLGYGYYNWKEDDSDTTIIFAKTSGNGSNIKDVVTLLSDQVEEDHESKMAEQEGIQATSVKRKRRLKMNRHKLKKRRKAQRALKRRLGH